MTIHNIHSEAGHGHAHREGRACMSRRSFLLSGGALITLAALPGGALAALQALKSDYPAVKVAGLSQLKLGEPIPFNYPYDDVRNIIVKLGVPAGGGIGPDQDIVAFNQQCTHQGGPLDGTFKREHQILGPCPLHLTTFDLTRHGMIVSGHATESLPQIVLELRGDDIYATGVLGLIYGYSANLAGRRV
ncbi:MAG TPA: arsenate reductase (azurin) small subunit [Rhodocyclaceae bacterium]|nr:arsenate reductase (azurin) small subunit [Rhodocyclaceae bacterium]